MNPISPQPTPQTASALPAQAHSGHCSLDSVDILRGQKTVAISHNGSVYKLQATRLGKLILTK